MKSLPLFHRIGGQRVVVVAEGTMGEAKMRLVERAGGICVSEAEAHGARLAFVALEDENAARKAALRLKRAGLLVNVADRPELCDFTTPSILDRDPVLIAVGTGGASAGLAKHIRLRLERLLPQSLGMLAERLSDARERMRQAWPDGDERRRAVDAALGEGGMLDPLAADAHERVGDWLDSRGTQEGGRTVTITLASDDPEDLTLRQARLLGLADTIVHDEAVPAAILARARADAERVALPYEAPEKGLTIFLRSARHFGR